MQDQIGELIDDDESMCNMLNKFFTSVFTKEDLSYIPNVGKRDTYESDPKLEDFLITTSDIHKHINNNNNNNTSICKAHNVSIRAESEAQAYCGVKR